MWVSEHPWNQPVSHDAAPDVCIKCSPCLPQKPCGRHWYWNDTGWCLLPLLPSQHQPHYLVGTLPHALHLHHLHLSFHLQGWKKITLLHEQIDSTFFFIKPIFMDLSVLWKTVIEYTVHTNSSYKETYGNFHECKMLHMPHNFIKLVSIHLYVQPRYK